MLREILNALKGKDTLDEIFLEIGKMLQAGRWMFDQASEVLLRKVDWESISDKLYERDREINQIEQSVRERILTHLSMGNQSDLAACLIIMSVVKDAERIGDYCKNLFEVGKFYNREYSHAQYARPMEDIRAAVDPLFEKTEKAFLEADRSLARRVIDTAGSLRHTCDLLVQQLLSGSDDLAPDEAVAYVLLARSYKRVVAHLGNIASGVVSPVSMIDYLDE